MNPTCCALWPSSATGIVKVQKAAGGLIPMSVTLASSPVYEAFMGETKLQALLHGHSYSGHVAGASAGIAALTIFADPALNPALQPGGGQLQELWPMDLVQRISHLATVDSIVALGGCFAPILP